MSFRCYAIVDDAGTPRNVIVTEFGWDLLCIAHATKEWVESGSLLSYFMGTASDDIEALTETGAVRRVRPASGQSQPGYRVTYRRNWSVS